MALEDYKNDLFRCARCSHCKFIPFAQVKSWRFAYGCPSIARYNFHIYSAGGRHVAAHALLEGRINYTEKLIDAVFACQMGGLCDVSCKIVNDRETLEMLREIRAKFVKDGQVPLTISAVIEGLRREDNMLGQPRADRAKWAEGLDVKDVTVEKAEVVYHAGCLYSYDPELQHVPRITVSILKRAGVDVGILGKREMCCGVKAYDMGFQGEFLKYAESNIDAWNNVGAQKVVLSCADGYGLIKELYPRLGKTMRFEVLHISEFLDQLVQEGKLKLGRELPIQVTYHDPCHLARIAEWLPNPGKEHKVLNQLVIREWDKVHRSQGVHEAPRNLLRRIPGLSLIEMERIKEYTWCCGAGGGVKEAYPDFALWTASERINEAKATGASALVTACGWCRRNLKDAVSNNGGKLEVYDLVELLEQAIV